MTGNELDEKFIEQQKGRLLDRKAELEQMQREAQEVSRERSQEYQDTQPDSGDESQYLFEREVDATLGQQFGQELKDVNRALEKIEEGTYGLSDRSGEPIAKGRLEAIPEALYTIEEQQRREGERRPPV
ncbi:MAG TPA: TraR/DksA C4-type zinc finger protein [Rubrobacteraceae bacterium]